MDWLSRLLIVIVAVIVAAILLATFVPNGDEEEPNIRDSDSGCPLAVPGSMITEALSGCTMVASDTASDPDPLPFWGKIDCEENSRHRQVMTGGDPQPAADGKSQGNEAFRRLTVREGDDVFGERCELGFNNALGPTAFYREGQRQATFISVRLPPGTDPTDSKWRTVLQMKQAQPYNNPHLSPAFELQVRDGDWVVEASWKDLWYTPAKPDQWTRFAFDVLYSSNPETGAITGYVDLNSDGDFADKGERSPTLNTATLRAETEAGDPSPYAPGESIPSHLRAGIYLDPDHNCPDGCSVDIDNVQVIRP